MLENANEYMENHILYLNRKYMKTSNIFDIYEDIYEDCYEDIYLNCEERYEDIIGRL